MTDKIAYILIDHGMDGREPETIVFAAYTAEARDAWYDASPNRNYYSKEKRIIEVEKEYDKAMRTLYGIERLVLDLEQRPTKKNLDKARRLV